VTVLAEKKANPGRRFGQPKAPLAELGEHPESKAAVRVMSGKYGPYITDGDTNANVPKGTDPKALTLAEAVELLRIRAEQGGGKKKKKKAKAPKAEKPAKATKEAKAVKASTKKEKPAKASTDGEKPAATAKTRKPPAKKKALETT
jgi:DNA topoisomerase-1